MKDKNKKELEAKLEDCEVIDDDNLEQVVGGKMQGNIVINDTTPISENTKKKI